jgi:MFS family permease
MGLSRYQWLVLLAAWLGWGFDVFDALLFNYVAPNCIPALLGITIGSPEARVAVPYWTGILTAILLVGWAVGGVVFGLVCDRLGRVRTMMVTMCVYALGTAACAFAPNLWTFIAFRVIASLGIGGEWAAGASMVAEAVPEKSRVEAAALLYTASPLGLVLATSVTYWISGVWLAGSPETSWRFVFLCGLVPAAIAFAIRLWLHEPERWTRAAASATPVRLRELFEPGVLRLTLCGAIAVLIALITWWSTNAFLPIVVTDLVRHSAEAKMITDAALTTFIEERKLYATLAFNAGGLAGILLSVPIAKRFGRRPMFGLYFALSAASIYWAFGTELAPGMLPLVYLIVGIGVYGVCGVFTYYLPELFPTRLRGTGSGFCYNIGRVVAAPGPFIVGAIAARGAANEAILYVGLIPLLGLAILPLIVETRERTLA